ncbi:MAG: DinB family protein [Bacteroidia bacterium]|nr:DinB family protein [Bacteroidia bacterium]
MDLSKEDIIQELEVVLKELTDFCSDINDQLFFQQAPEKWSVAQNVKHLITSARMTNLAFSFPKFVIKIYAGKPNRSSRSFDELVAKYKLKLSQGGRASGRFVPKIISEKEGKENLLHHFSKAMQHVEISIQKKWKDPQLDQYIAPHPLLGKITLRELCYFTIYHTRHHLEIIKNRVAA